MLFLRLALETMAGLVLLLQQELSSEQSSDYIRTRFTFRLKIIVSFRSCMCFD